MLVVQQLHMPAVDGKLGQIKNTLQFQHNILDYNQIWLFIT